MATGSYSFEIDAPVERVWEALSETGQYNSWNPFIVRATGPASPGATVEMVCAFNSGKTLRGPAKITACEHHTRLAWSLNSAIPGFRSWKVDLNLSPLGESRTSLSITTDLSGISSLVGGPKIDEVHDGFERMISALERREETRAAAWALPTAA